MCAQFTIKGNTQQISAVYRAKIRNPEIAEWSERIFPHTNAPVIVGDGKTREIRIMRFSLVPAWSKDPKPKFATYNARLESYDEKLKKKVFIYEKPTWRQAFQSRHCLVPISEFIEPAYTGRMSGNMLKFADEKAAVLAAAGIWEEWISKETGEIIESFAILTDDPDEYVKDLGHDRTPVFLREDAFDEWLSSEKKSPSESVDFLRKNKASVTLKAEIDRALKKKVN